MEQQRRGIEAVTKMITTMVKSRGVQWRQGIREAVVSSGKVSEQGADEAQEGGRLAKKLQADAPPRPMAPPAIAWRRHP